MKVCAYLPPNAALPLFAALRMPVPCSYTHNPHNNDDYLAYNKPGGIMHFLENVGACCSGGSWHV